MNGELDKQLDVIVAPKPVNSVNGVRFAQEAETLPSARSLPAKISVPNLHLPAVLPVPPSTINLDALRDILVTDHGTNKTPKTPTPRNLTTARIYSCEDTYRPDQPGGGFFLQSKFEKALRTEMQRAYEVDITISKTKDTSHLENTVYIVTFESANEGQMNEAKEALKSLFKSAKIKIIDDQSGWWTKVSACVRIIQAYSEQNERLHISCEHSAIGPLIAYFEEKLTTAFPRLCITEDTLNKILKEKFRSVDIALPASSDLGKENTSFFAQEILKLEEDLRLQPVLIKLEQRCIHLFGVNDVATEVEQQIEAIKAKYASNVVKLDLTPAQIEYLLDIHLNELRELEGTFAAAQILERLPYGEFIAPSYVHQNIEERIMKLATLCLPIQWTIADEAFCPIAHDECSTLVNIGRQNKCHIEVEEQTTEVVCPIPEATAKDHVSNKLTAAAIKIQQDDLTEQKVDLVVVCSTSLYLCQNILKKAGPTVQVMHTQIQSTSPLEPFELDGGDLKCRKLLFLPWNIDLTNSSTFTQSIRTFVRTAVEHAIKAHHTSIAFPSIGCGKLNVSENIIANEMLVEAQKQLLTGNVLLQIIFVILPEQVNVFKAFESKLASLQQGNVEVKDTQITYRLTKLTLTALSSNKEKQEQCRRAINDYVSQSVAVCEHVQQTALKKWTQPALNKFFRFCQQRHVVIDINVQIGYLKLSGSKISVADAEKEFLRELAAQSEQARLAVIARDIIWAYGIDQNNWEKYPPNINVIIEDLYSSKVPSFNYTDENGQECTIDFQTMTEKCLSTNQQRPIIRQADFSLPEYWQVQSNTVEQFPVQANSTEYNDIIALFNQTMTGNYTQIVRLDRIQNKPWYMQYNSYRNFSSKQHTERKLFHGCPQQTAPLITNSFFNRSFAGINGTVYGQGAYFSTRAVYSHSYASSNPQTGERCMFVARVLVGDTIIGNTKMKTPPPGYDSTTDGNHIFVTYRDDQAYAAYLIVYK